MSSSNPAAKVPRISVVIPAYNAAATLSRCLDALFAQVDDEVEVIVVDDCSSDATRKVAARYRVSLIAMSAHRGDGPARNLGVLAARGDVLFFLDADVAFLPGTFARARSAIAEPGFDAVIGSYDDAPAERSTVSLFKNLVHHYFHQRSGGKVTTFWTACGLVRRQLFLSLGGLDEKTRGIRDVEFGYRLAAAGAWIRLDPGLQVKHLKRWTLGGLLATDLSLRAIPWAALLMKHGYLPSRLNFPCDQKWAALTAVALAAATILALRWPVSLILMVLLLCIAAWINRNLYRLFLRRGGFELLIGGFLLQQFYYLYSIAGLIVGILIYLVGLVQGQDQDENEVARRH